VRLVLLTSAGNQGFIFASNRLREAVGASEIVRTVTTDWVRDACAAVSETPGQRAVVLRASSGGALVLADDGRGGADAAADLTWRVTSAALARAPGLDVFGSSVAINGSLPTREEVGRVFAAAGRRQASRPAAATRFGRLPVVAACSSTDLPAAVWRSDAPADGRGRPLPGEDPVPLSAEARAKRAARPAADRRMRTLLGPAFPLVDIDDFFDVVEWVGVVHADGNGLGGVFQRAGELLADARAVAKLSERVQAAADVAFRAAALAVPVGGRGAPLVPLVVGGDDLTVLVDGAAALPFARAYLDGFGAATARDELIRTVTGGRGLTAAAGVAVVKPHFPFSSAYGLAAQLCRNAKDTIAGVGDASAAAGVGLHGVDVHVLFDNVVTSLPALRERLRVPAREGSAGSVMLHERPFFLPAPGAELPAHARHRHIDAVLARARAVQGRAGGRANGDAVSRSQLHGLREDVYADPGRAQRRFADLWRRSAPGGEDRAVLTLLAGAPGDPPSLFRPVDGDGGQSTALVDAVELADLAAAWTGGAS